MAFRSSYRLISFQAVHHSRKRPAQGQAKTHSASIARRNDVRRFFGQRFGRVLGRERGERQFHFALRGGNQLEDNSPGSDLIFFCVAFTFLLTFQISFFFFFVKFKKLFFC